MNKNMSYLQRVEETCIAANHKALMYRDGKAWDNKKSKNLKQYTPRGKAYQAVMKREHMASWLRLKLSIDSVIALSQELKANL
jgi:hypothetical protein